MEEPEMEHPLQNHLVVSKILDFAQPDFANLKHFRLVCSLWYTVSLDKWRQSAIVRLKQDGGDYETSDSDGGIKISEFSECLVNTDVNNNTILQLKRKPYFKYKLKDWFSRNMDKQKDLWKNVVAPSVKYLIVENCYWADSTELEDTLLACDNLEQLKLHNCSYGCCRMRMMDTIKREISRLVKLKKLEVSGGMPMQWSKLLVHTPNLQSLAIKQNLNYERTTFASFLLDLHQLEFAGRHLQKLKHLDIMEADVTFLDFVSLSSRVLNLEVLSIQFEKVRPEQFLKPLLEAQAPTLKVLKVCRVSNRSEGPFDNLEFPYGVNMPRLEELLLWGHVVKDLGFLRWFPKLKVLRVSRDTFEKRRLLRRWGSGAVVENIPEDLVENEELPECTEIRDFYTDARFTVNSLLKLKRCMPKLERLTGVMNNDAMYLVCDLWPQLKEIGCLVESDVDDGGIRRILQLEGLETVKVDMYCYQSKISDAAFKPLEESKIGSGCGKWKLLEMCVSKELSPQVELKLKESQSQAVVKLYRNYSKNCSESQCICSERKQYAKWTNYEAE